MAHVRKLPSGRFQGVAKDGRERLGTRTFDRKSDALMWARCIEESAQGINRTASLIPIKKVLEKWLEVRKIRVSEATVDTDGFMVGSLSVGLLRRQIGAVSTRDVQKWMDELAKKDKSRPTIKRYRESLSAFFAWSIIEGYRKDNPALGTVLPKTATPAKEIQPFTAFELGEVVANVRHYSEYYADVVAFLGFTGLRWGEARALRVGDVARIPRPALSVHSSKSEGRELKDTKSGYSRRVPLTTDALAVVERQIKDKELTELVFTGPKGGALSRSRMIETAHWEELGRGRSFHDLRHTAACMWLEAGVSLKTVSAWLGHADIGTTDRYLHYLGDSADDAAIGLLNARGAYGAHETSKSDRLG